MQFSPPLSAVKPGRESRLEARQLAKTIEFRGHEFRGHNTQFSPPLSAVVPGSGPGGDNLANA